jgi:hypothetical protein
VRKAIGGAAKIFDFYVDSTRPNDAGDGLTPATAKRTIAAVMALVTGPGKSVGLVRGSRWTETVLPVFDMSIGVTDGVGAPPVFDCRDVATGWTRHDPGALPNVWSVSWTRNGPVTGSDDIGLWVDEVRPRLANTLGDLNTGGGWFVFPGDSRAITATIYVHSTVDPNTDGKVRKIAKRNSGFNWHPQTSASTAVVALEGPIEVVGALGHYNAVAAGPGSVKKIVARDGHIHHFVSCAALSEDLVATAARPLSDGIPFTAYRANGVGFDAVRRRCHVLMPGGAARELDVGFHAHSSTGNALIDSFTIEACTVRGRSGMSAGALVQTARDFYFEDPHTYGVDLNAMLTTVERGHIHDTGETPLNGASVGIRKTNPDDAVNTVSDMCIRLMKGIGATGAGTGRLVFNRCSVRVGSNGFNGGVITLNRCIVHSDARALSFIDPGYIGDYNVFFPFPGQGEPWFHHSTNGLTTYNSLVNWRTWTGQDANSVFVKEADQTSGNQYAFWLGVKNGTGGPEVGDFRINPGARVYGDGGDAPDTAYIGTFVDGTPITYGGAQAHYNHNTRSVVAGPVTRRPTLPAVGDTAGEHALAMGTWNFYP